MTDHIEDLISAYIDYELTEEERKLVEEHLEQCLECSALRNDLLAIQNQIFTSLRPIEAPVSLEDKVITELKMKVSTSRTRLRKWFLVPILTVLVLFVIVAIFSNSILFNLSSILVKFGFNMIYAIGNVLGAEPLMVLSMAVIALVIIITSGLSIKHLLKSKVIQGDSI
ncbi:anti-sigma factor family protein [Paenibacillus hexagrammi]|uniref:Anti-sigma-W factor RsiW n=1 Tax=Paenibacillus hexagrammi TaxID=2908839 RepID=A0ABY3SNW7_9BACL|nr:zf-HC2 domain-containing protein [Paenibacillus sp. YPD9-1]UJF35654.1 zf-HC2 domain-containing protein [Paenibacillus sp. YPD9-1]